MNKKFGYLVLGLLPLAAFAQQTTAPVTSRIYISSADVADRVAKARAAGEKGEKQSDDVHNLISTGPFTGVVVYRNAPVSAYSANDDYVEYYIVLDGSGTMLMGGTLVNPKRTGPRAESATVDGAKYYPVKKGDMFIVPVSTPHGLSKIDGKDIIFMSMHLPVPVQPGHP
jgi:mannose-6-phosphate isomerase-like protein (cupin superfamily)